MSLDIANLRKLLGAATPGPWHREWSDSHPDPANIEILHVGRGDRIALIEEPDDAAEVADADLIVALRNAAPALLDEVGRLRAYRDRTEAALQAWCEDLTKFTAETDDTAMRQFTQSEIEGLKESGLWRDAKDGAS